MGRHRLEAPQGLATLSSGGPGAPVSAQASCSLAFHLLSQRTLLSSSIPSSLQMLPGPHLDTLSCLASGLAGSKLVWCRVESRPTFGSYAPDSCLPQLPVIAPPCSAAPQHSQAVLGELRVWSSTPGTCSSRFSYAEPWSPGPWKPLPDSE